MSSSNYFIGIDQGTQSTKAVIFDRFGTELFSTSQSLKLNYSESGLISQSPDDIFLSVIQTLKKVLADSQISPKDFGAIAIDSQICSMVAVDEFWHPVYELISHLDVSSNEIRDQLLEDLGDKIISQNGSMPYIASRLLWLKETYPTQFNNAARVMLAGPYCSGKLCSLPIEEAFTDHTTMNVFGWGDITKRAWDKDLANNMNIDCNLSPVIKEPQDIIGGLSEEYAEICGLPSGLPIIAGSGDAIAGWIGLGADKPGMLVDTSGTANHLCVCVDKFIPDISDRILSYYPSLTESLGYQIGFTAGTGKSHSWFIELLLCNPFSESKVGHPTDHDYLILDRAAQEIEPLSNGVIFIPHFGGRTCPPQPELRGGWLGIEWHHNFAHLYRSILESIAYEYALYMRKAQDLYPEMNFDFLYSVGGGSRSELWAQIKADILGIPVRILPGSENFASRGSALLAARSVNRGDEFKAARHKFQAEEYMPDVKNNSTYQDFIKKYHHVIKNIQPA